MKRVFFAGVLCAGVFTGLVKADPQADSWFKGGAGKYARVYLTTNDQANSITYTTWSRGTTQAVPAYVGVQSIYQSTNWTYVKTTGLGAHNMGPWYLDGQKQSLFQNLPVNTKTVWRFPRVPVTNIVTHSISGGGAVGYFVDGVSMFNGWDAFSWNGTAEVGAGATTYSWNRDAYYNEYPSFDNNNAHQPPGGQHHYHVNAPAPRWELGDHVDYNAATKSWSESTNAVTKHSPILGWVVDGHPIYGPYGYSNALDASSAIVRMRSGYQLRNGQMGTDVLSNNVSRATIPAWAVRAFGTVTNNVPGPSVASYPPLGRYMEDNAWIGDLTNSVTHTNYQQGVDFDLDEYNGRWCVTPDFTNGVYAYFVTITTNALPTYPYLVGRAYHASPTGGVASISEPVVTNYVGGGDAIPALNTPAIPANVTITWSAVEGGTYLVENTTNFATWSPVITNAPAVTNTGIATNTVASLNFYRVTRVALSNYDSVGTTTAGGGVGISSIVPNSGSRGTTVPFTINLAAGAPPTNAPVISLTIGTNAIAGATHPTATTVTGNFVIGSGAATGAQDILLVWPGPPTNNTAHVTNSLPAGFTIQ